MTVHQMLPCGACGIEDYDVWMTLVEFPEAEQREVEVYMPVDHSMHARSEPIVVRERYAREPRCRDKDACADRVAAFTPRPEPVMPATIVAPPVEEEPIW